MNTFAVLLLSYPFYLAVNGRLTAYTSLVNKSTATPAAQPASSNTVQPVQPVS